MYLCIRIKKQLVMSGNCEQCIVREFSSLKALNKTELIHLSNCKDSYSVKKGDTIFNEGDTMNGVYCIKEGTGKIVKMNSKGKNTILKFIKKGELLGQRSVLSDEPSNLSAVAVEDMKVCFIPKKELLSFFNENNKFSLEVTKDICFQLKEANEFSANHTHRTVKERLAFTLLHLNELAGSDKDGILNIQLSRDEIASTVGTATESCIRLLAELKKAALIELIGKRIKIVNHVELQKLAN